MKTFSEILVKMTRPVSRKTAKNPAEPYLVGVTT
jgi:hypothetical protein